MASTLHAVSGALVALAFWTGLGYPIVRRLLPRAAVGPFAPIAGWAVHGVVAVPVFFVVPFTTFFIAAVGLAALVLAWTFARFERRRGNDPTPSRVRIPVAAWIGAALLAAAVAAAVAPKPVGDAVHLSDQIFDHAKVAIVADIARLGMPPGNPFIAEAGPGRLSYYYLWHFSAAEVVRVTGITAWEAEVAMTFFSAFTSLAAMMGAAVLLAGRAGAAPWVVALAASASSRPVLVWLFGKTDIDRVMPSPGGFGGWLFQSAWVPQHLASTSCVLLVLLLMDGLKKRPGLAGGVVLGLTMAAAFECSTWIGGVVFAIVCVVVVPLVTVRAQPARRIAVVVSLAVAGLVTLLFAWPFVVDQFAASATRQRGSPIAIAAFEVLGDPTVASLGPASDLAAFWLVLLPVELTAVYLPGLITLFRLRASRTGAAPLIGAAALVALLVAWLLRSTLADNNDLAWRAGLLAATLLIVFAAVGASSWFARRRWLAVTLVLCGIGLGLPQATVLIRGNLEGHRRPAGRDFAEAPEMWAHVRDHTAIDERVANAPRAFETLTPWPVNIGWSLLADRRSCDAGWELTQVYSSVPHGELRAIEARFIRVFDGHGTADDVKELATRHDCAVAVVTARDGAWTRDPFRDSAWYALVEERPDRWRIYRRR